MPLTPRTKRLVQLRLHLLFWGCVAILAATLGLVALLSRDIRFTRATAAPATAEQKK